MAKTEEMEVDKKEVKKDDKSKDKEAPPEEEELSDEDRWGQHPCWDHDRECPGAVRTPIGLGTPQAVK